MNVGANIIKNLECPPDSATFLWRKMNSMVTKHGWKIADECLRATQCPKDEAQGTGR